MLVSHVMLPSTPIGEVASLRYGDAVLSRWQADAERASVRLADFISRWSVVVPSFIQHLNMK